MIPTRKEIYMEQTVTNATYFCIMEAVLRSLNKIPAKEYSGRHRQRPYCQAQSNLKKSYRTKITEKKKKSSLAAA